MNELLQLVGSLASIGSIPLAIYLYLRTREARYAKLRAEVIQTLSYRIGEGGSLSIFEIRAVADSKCRDARIKPADVPTPDIVEDLVTQTISSPLLDAKRKQEIVENLSSIHTEAGLVQAIDRLRITPDQLLAALESLRPGEKAEIDSLRASVRQQYEHARKDEWSSSISSLFAAFAAGLTVLSFVVSQRDLPERIAEVISRADVKVLLGALISLLAGVASAALASSMSARNSKRKK